MAAMCVLKQADSKLAKYLWVSVTAEMWVGVYKGLKSLEAYKCLKFKQRISLFARAEDLN